MWGTSNKWGISNKWRRYYSDVENKLREHCIDITDFDEDDDIWPEYRDGISADDCAQHIIDWTKEDNNE